MNTISKPMSPTDFQKSIIHENGGLSAPLPFMNRLEIRAIETCINLFQGPVQALEWGSGASTVYFASQLPTGSTYDSIEHNPKWLNKVEVMINEYAIKHIHTHFVPNNCEYPIGTDGDYEAFRDYILFPTNLGKRFHLIFVDGRTRSDCMQAGWTILEDTGVMILHDAQRIDYDKGIPRESFYLKMTNPKIQIEGSISILFVSKSRSFISRLASSTRLQLPDHIKLESCCGNSGF